MNTICPTCKSVMILEPGNAYHGARICPYCGVVSDVWQEKVRSALQEIKDQHRPPDVVALRGTLAALVFPDDQHFNVLAASAVFFDLIVQDEDYRRYVLNHYDLLKWFLERIASPLPSITDGEIEPMFATDGVALVDWLACDLPERWQRLALCSFLQRHPQAALSDLLRAAEDQDKRFVGILKKLAEQSGATDEQAYHRILRLLASADQESRERFFQQVRRADGRYAAHLERELLITVPTTTLTPAAPVPPAHTPQGSPEPPAHRGASRRAPLSVMTALWNPPGVQERSEHIPQGPQPPLASTAPLPGRTLSRFTRVFFLVLLSILLLGYGAIAIYYSRVLQPLTTRTANDFSATVTSLVHTNTLLQRTVTASIDDGQATATALTNGTFGAAFVGQSPRASVHAGDTIALYFVLQNTGTSTWFQSGDYQFVCVADQAQYQSSQYTASCLDATNPDLLGNNTVRPEQYYVFSFVVQIPFSAPPTTVYRTYWQLQHQTQTSLPGYIALVVV